jgi:hypothetical protein
MAVGFATCMGRGQVQMRGDLLGALGHIATRGWWRPACPPPPAVPICPKLDLPSQNIQSPSSTWPVPRQSKKKKNSRCAWSRASLQHVVRSPAPLHQIAAPLQRPAAHKGTPKKTRMALAAKSVSGVAVQRSCAAKPMLPSRRPSRCAAVRTEAAKEQQAFQASSVCCESSPPPCLWGRALVVMPSHQAHACQGACYVDGYGPGRGFGAGLGLRPEGWAQPANLLLLTVSVGQNPSPLHARAAPP